VITKPARRTFLQSLAYFIIGTAAVAACDRSRPSQQAPAAVSDQTAVPAERAHCDDVAGLSKADVARRSSVHYTDHAPDPARSCGNCTHLQPVPGSDSPCKRCSIVAGPVHVNGWCNVWLERTSAAG